jgi:hypothetical protein
MARHYWLLPVIGAALMFAIGITACSSSDSGDECVECPNMGTGGVSQKGESCSDGAGCGCGLACVDNKCTPYTGAHAGCVCEACPVENGGTTEGTSLGTSDLEDIPEACPGFDQDKAAKAYNEECGEIDECTEMPSQASGCYCAQCGPVGGKIECLQAQCALPGG